MEMEKIRIGVFFGGRSSEHEVSVRSASSVIRNLDKSKYKILPVGVNKSGEFFFGERAISSNMQLASQMLKDLRSGTKDSFEEMDCQSEIGIGDIAKSIDVAFSVIHGSFGEDGTLQGFLHTIGVPFVGPGVLGSAIGMDKDVSKRLLQNAGIPIARHRTYRRHEYDNINYEEIASALGDIVFVKPANLGSSVGISKVGSRTDFDTAVDEAFLYDNKIIIEESIKGREIECAVLGNENPKASVPGEIVVKGCFYSYGAKYLNEYEVDLKIPADLPQEVSMEIQKMALKAFNVLCCEGMARVDFFLKDDFEILLNEINTIPCFTDISMYPKLFEASGIAYDELLDSLVMLAISRHDRDSSLRIGKCCARNLA